MIYAVFPCMLRRSCGSARSVGKRRRVGGLVCPRGERVLVMSETLSMHTILTGASSEVPNVARYRCSEGRFVDAWR